jgi:hypothetical protein
MAAGAIPPPLFFARRRLESPLREWHFQEHPETQQVSVAELSGRRQSAPATRDGSPLKDI